MNGIDPRIGKWCNFVAFVLTGIGAGAVQWGKLPPDTVDIIKTLAADGLFLLTGANIVFGLFDAPSNVSTGLKRLTAPPH